MVVAPSLWARLQAQAEWPLLVAIGALLLHFLGVLKDLAPDARGNRVQPGDTA